jgi:DNA primase
LRLGWETSAAFVANLCLTVAGRIPQSFINDLLTRVDIIDVVGSRITLKKAGKDHKALCPFHNEKTPSFTVSSDKQFYHCFGCGESGTPLTFLMEHDRMEFVEAVEALAQMAGVEVPREQNARPTPDRTDLYDLLTAAEGHFRTQLKGSSTAVDYLKGRGLTGIIARDFGIGYAPDEWHGLGESLTKLLPSSREKDMLDAGLLIRGEGGQVYDRFRGRIMFPIRDTRGRVIGFGGRVLGRDDGPKYLNSPETPVFHKGHEVYGLYEARKANRNLDRVLMVEGYMDVVALAQGGITNAVATLGTAATKEHFQKLYRYVSEVICCFDGDAAGRQAAWRALEHALGELRDGRQLKFMFLPDGEDPDSLVQSEGSKVFLTRVAGAQPAIEYLYQRLSADLDLASLDDQAKLANLMMPHIEQVPEGILKQLMLNRLHTQTGFTPGGGSSGARGARRGGQSRSQSRLPALVQRLVASAIQQPSLVASLEADTLAQLTAEERPGIFEELARYVVANPEAETPELVGRWVGHELEAELQRLAQWRSGLAVDAMAAEFTDGVGRYLAQRAQAGRREMLADLKAQPTAENLRRYWDLKQGKTGSD